MCQPMQSHARGFAQVMPILRNHGLPPPLTGKAMASAILNSVRDIMCQVAACCQRIGGCIYDQPYPPTMRLGTSEPPTCIAHGNKRTAGDILRISEGRERGAQGRALRAVRLAGEALATVCRQNDLGPFERNSD